MANRCHPEDFVSCRVNSLCGVNPHYQPVFLSELYEFMNISADRFTAFALALALALPLCGTAAISAADQPSNATALKAPRPFDAEYQARASGMRTSAYRRLTRIGDNRYEVSHGLSLRVLRANMLTVSESSEFSWHDSGALPHSYHFEQSGVRRRNEQVLFDWDNQQAVMTRDGQQQQLPLESGSLDNLSFSVHMSALLMAAQQRGDNAAFEEGTMYSFTIVDGRDIDEMTYRILGEEKLSTPIGELLTLKAERVRDPDSRRSTLLWLAKDYDFVLARIEQTESGGSRMELILQSITME